MNQSIQQYLSELVERIENYAKTGNITNLDRMSEDIFEDCKKFSLQILRELTDNLNQSIRCDKEIRKREGLVLKEKERERTVLLKLGSFTYARDYYQEKESKKYRYLLDEILSVEKYERISNSVSADLVTKATEYSYAKSSELVTGSAVSRQTVKRKIEEVASLEIDIPEEKREVDTLHLYADEDHIHLQKPEKAKGKKSQRMPLVTVTEGRIEENIGRNRNINPVHFVDEEMDTSKLWMAVDGYIQQSYHFDGLKQIVVHGDGAPWIQSGLKDYSNVIYVLDEYHLAKYTKKISRLFPSRHIKVRIYAAIESGDRKRIDWILQELIEESMGEKEKEEAVKEYGKYILNHFDAIRERLSRIYPGSCTEGLVSHVLSKRMSRDPLGWSKLGAGKLSKLRIYVLNGGVIHAGDFSGDEKEPYSNYSQRIIEEIQNGRYDWSMYEHEKYIFDGNSGTQRLIRDLGRTERVS